MTTDDPETILTDLVEGTLRGPQWDAWLARHPQAASEVATAQRVRSLLTELRTLDVTLSPDFEARLLERIHADRTLLDLLDLGLAGFGQAFLELLNILFGQPPTAQPTLA